MYIKQAREQGTSRARTAVQVSSEVHSDQRWYSKSVQAVSRFCTGRNGQRKAERTTQVASLHQPQAVSTAAHTETPVRCEGRRRRQRTHWGRKGKRSCHSCVLRLGVSRYGFSRVPELARHKLSLSTPISLEARVHLSEIRKQTRISMINIKSILPPPPRHRPCPPPTRHGHTSRVIDPPLLTSLHTPCLSSLSRRLRRHARLDRDRRRSH